MNNRFKKEDEAFMRLALKKAAAGIKRGQTPFGACIVRLHRVRRLHRGRSLHRNRAEVVALEHNRVWQTTDITAHAEVRAIRVACRKLKTISLHDCVIYTTCEPCPMCFSACHWAGLKKIFYGASIEDAKGAGFNELFISAAKMKSVGRSPVHVYGGLLQKENASFLSAWGRSQNKKTY